MRATSRSKFATDIFYRLWDDARSCWVLHQGKTIWTTKLSVEKLKERLVETEGRNPDTLKVERVMVEVK